MIWLKVQMCTNLWADRSVTNIEAICDHLKKMKAKDGKKGAHVQMEAWREVR